MKAKMIDKLNAEVPKPAPIDSPAQAMRVEPDDTIGKGYKGLTYRGVMLEAAVASVAGIAAKREGLGVSQHLLILAHGCDTADTFREACKIQEKYIKSKSGMAEVRAAIDKADLDVVPADVDAIIGVVPPSWRQAKNNIARAWELGVNPKDYKTESALRIALNDKREKSQPAGVKRVLKSKAEIRKNLPASSVLLAALAHFTTALHSLPVKEQEKVAATIEKQAAEYAALAKKLVPVAPKLDKVVAANRKASGKGKVPARAAAIAA